MNAAFFKEDDILQDENTIEITAKVSADWQEQDFDSFLDSWIDFVEANGWDFGGGIKPGEFSGCLAAAPDNPEVDECDRVKILKYLEKVAGLSEIFVGPAEPYREEEDNA